MSSGVFSFWGKGKYTVRSIIIRCIVIMIGVVITGFGAAAYVMAALGADPVTAFVQGMGVQLHLDFGMAMNIFNIVFFVIILILNRKMINIGTVLYTFTLGTFSQIFIDMLGGMMGPDPGLVIKSWCWVLWPWASAWAFTSLPSWAADPPTLSTRPWPSSPKSPSSGSVSSSTP